MLEGCTFETDRLSVDSWRSTAHAAAVLLSHLTEDARQFLPDSLAEIRTIKGAETWLAQQEVDGTVVLFAEIVSTNEKGAILIASERSSSGLPDVYIGYLVSPGHRGRGVATELVRGFIDWLACNTGVGLVVAGVDASNSGSINVLTRSGFVEDAENDSSPNYLRFGRRIER